MIPWILQLINNNQCIQNNDLHINRTHELKKISEYGKKCKFEIGILGDIVSEIFLMLEFENNIFENIQKEINNYYDLLTNISTRSYSADIQEISKTGLFIISHMTKNKPILSKNNKVTKILYILPIQNIIILTPHAPLILELKVNTSYECSQNVYINYAFFNRPSIFEKKYYTEFPYYKTMNLFPYFEKNYIGYRNENDNSIKINLETYNECVKYYIVYIKNTKLEVIYMNLSLDGILDSNDIDIDFYRTFFPRLYYKTELPHNSFLIPFCNNDINDKNKMPVSYFYDKFKNMNLELEIRFDMNEELKKTEQIEFMVITHSFSPGYKTIQDYIDRDSYDIKEMKTKIDELYYSPPGISPGFQQAEDSWNKNHERLSKMNINI